jgi:hypothetical protein
MRKYFLIALSLAFVFGSCRHYFGKRVKGNGNIRSEDRSVGSFKNVDVSGETNVYVTQGQEGQHSVRIEGDENLLQYVEVIQEGEKVIIRNKRGYNLQPSDNIKVYVTSPVYSNIDVSGAGDIIGQNKIVNPEELGFHLSGAGDIKMEVDAPALKVDISGAGSIHISGQTKDLEVEMSGAGHAHLYDLKSENTRVNVSGVGSADVFASVKLDAEVSGVGSVTYKGDATNVSQHVSGVGSVSKAN